MGRLGQIRPGKTPRVQQLQGPVARGQHLSPQLGHVTVLDVGQRHLKNLPLELQLQMVGLRRDQGLHHLTVDQTELARDRRLHIDLPHLQLHRQGCLQALDASGPERGHAVSVQVGPGHPARLR